MLVYVESSAPMSRTKYDPTAPSEVALRCKLLRIGEGWTVDFVASLAGVSRNAWYNYEDPHPVNHRNPRHDVAVVIEIKTGYPAEWIERGIVSRLAVDKIKKLEKAQWLIEQAEREEARKAKR